MNTHGGRRTGAGRPKSARTVVHRVSVEAQLMKRLKDRYSTGEINQFLRKTLKDIDDGKLQHESQKRDESQKNG